MHHAAGQLDAGRGAGLADLEILDGGERRERDRCRGDARRGERAWGDVAAATAAAVRMERPLAARLTWTPVTSSAASSTTRTLPSPRPKRTWVKPAPAGIGFDGAFSMPRMSMATRGGFVSSITSKVPTLPFVWTTTRSPSTFTPVTAVAETFEPASSMRRSRTLSSPGEEAAAEGAGVGSTSVATGAAGGSTAAETAAGVSGGWASRAATPGSTLTRTVSPCGATS